MNLDKALRKQRKSYVRFMLTMSFIFIINIVVFCLSDINHWYYLTTLVVIEIIILLAIVYRVREENFKFYSSGKHARLSFSFPKRLLIIPYEFIDGVHIDYKDKEKDILIYIFTHQRLRGDVWKTLSQLDKNNLPLQNMIKKLKVIKNKDMFYCYILKTGGKKKLLFLKFLYTNAYHSYFSPEVIEAIKSFDK